MRKFAYVLVYVVSVVVVVGSLLSLLTDTDNRYLKILDFPRVQFFWAAAACLALVSLLAERVRPRNVAILAGLAVALVVQAVRLAPYTPLVGEAVPDAPADVGDDERFSALIVNVKMRNRQAAPLVELIRERDPDMVLAMETDAWWDTQLAALERAYPYTQEVVNDRAYGMLLYSRLPLSDVEVHYRQNEDVPSFSMTAELPSGTAFALHTVHPVPPTFFETLPDNEGEREVALLEVGDEVAAAELPAVVMGDFNDVAWAATGRLTGSDDLLHDVRVGRGFYNSFDAGNPVMRWPLDHVVVTDGWSVAALERLRDVGSDHFPIYVELAWAGE